MGMVWWGRFTKNILNSFALLWIDEHVSVFIGACCYRKDNNSVTPGGEWEGFGGAGVYKHLYVYRICAFSKMKNH